MVVMLLPESEIEEANGGEMLITRILGALERSPCALGALLLRALSSGEVPCSC